MHAFDSELLGFDPGLPSSLLFLCMLQKVFCQGALLEAVQNCHIFDDCKEFVDMPMRVDPEEILEVSFLMFSFIRE